jgi:hypothetical protein
MDPPEIIISKGNTLEQLDFNIQGCRNALLRTLQIPEAKGNNDTADAICDTKREKSFMLELIPSPSEWIFIGRILHLEKRKYAVHINSSSKDKSSPMVTAECSTLEYIFVCQINTSLQVSQTQQLQSLNRICIEAAIGQGRSPRETRFGESQDDLNLVAPLERKWISMLEVKTCLFDQNSSKLLLEKKFRDTAAKILDLHGESIVKKDIFIKAPQLPEFVRHDEIFVVEDNAPVAASNNLLLGDDRLVLVFCNL